MVNVFKKIDIKPLRNQQPVDGHFKKLAEKDYDYLGVFGSTLKQHVLSQHYLYSGPSFHQGMNYSPAHSG